MTLIPIFLLVGLFAVSGWAEEAEPEPYNPELVKKAEAGDAEAQYNLGQCHEKGLGVIKDNKEAVKWYTKSAEQEYAKADYAISQCYFEGKGVPRDKKEAKKWIMKVLTHASADELCAFVGYRFGPMCREFEWYRDLNEDEFLCLKMSAELGNAVAQFQLGYFYRCGRFVSKDQIEALNWWNKSAEQGDVQAQCELGWCYKYGYGVTKDMNEAVKWFTKAAEQGDAQAKRTLHNLLMEQKKGLRYSK